MEASGKEVPRTVCPVCVEPAVLTDDHVPPKNLFLKPRPSNTITVQACASCNGGSSLDDEYLRVLIATEASPGSHLHRLWKEKVVDSTFERSPALRAALAEEMLRIQAHHKIEPLTDYSGRVLSDSEVELVVPFDAARIDRVLHKIVRCLHVHHGHPPLPKSAVITTTSIDSFSDEVLETVVRGRSGMVGGEHGEFIYRFSEEDGCTVWRLMFYLTKYFTIRVCPA